MVSLTRAFSIRSQSSTTQEKPTQNKLTKSNSMRQTERIQISAPVLLSTTNVHTFSAEDVATAQKLRKVSSISSNSSRNSDKDSDLSSIPSRSRGASITDNSSVGSSPPSPKFDGSPIKHFAILPNSSPRRAKSSVNLKSTNLTHDELPPLPTRAPTHSKAAHERLARQRSLQTLIASNNANTNSWHPPSRPSPPRSVPNPTIKDSNREARTSMDIVGSPTQHPFGKELRQLDEIAEEFGGTARSAVNDAENQFMQSRGLKQFCADDYMRDLQPLFSHYFLPQPAIVGWI